MQDIHSISERTEELKYEHVFNECLYLLSFMMCGETPRSRKCFIQRRLVYLLHWSSSVLSQVWGPTGRRVHALSDCSEA